jgi:NAD-dependent deacetylase
MQALSSELAERIRRAQAILFFTGAGMSADSGIATFRDKTVGLWQRFAPEDLATPEAFEKDPALVWNWYEWRRMQVLQARPHAGHLAIARLARERPGVTVVTQNVDDLHERAGTPAVHLHGSLFAPRCFACARPATHAPTTDLLLAEAGRIEPPRCAHCGGRIRPGVVWFGESLPEDAWRRALELARNADLVVVVGTSAIVQPAAQIPLVAQKRGRLIVEINPIPALAADWSLAEGAATGVPRLLSVFGLAPEAGKIGI